MKDCLSCKYFVSFEEEYDDPMEQFAKVMKNLDNPSELRQIAKEYFKDDFPHGWYHGLPNPGRLKLHVRRRDKYANR